MSQQRLGGGLASSYGSTEYGTQSSFEETLKKISTLIFNVNKSGNDLDRHAKKLGTKDDNASLRTKIHEIQQEANKAVAQITELIRAAHGHASPSDRQQRLRIDRITETFKTTLETYNKIQKRVADQVKSVTLLSGGNDLDRNNDVWSEEANLIERERKREQLQQQQILVEDDLAIARDREERIRQIETDVLDINEIFKELGTLVFEQGETINDIESQVTHAADNVEAGKEQLQQAETYQKSYRKKLCVLAIIIILILGVVGLILGLTLKKKT